MGEQKKSYKAGRNKDKGDTYRKRGTRTKHKINRVRKSNGHDAAEAYKHAVNMIAIGGQSASAAVGKAKALGVPPRGWAAALGS